MAETNVGVLKCIQGGIFIFSFNTLTQYWDSVQRNLK